MPTSQETILDTWTIVRDGFLDAYDACTTEAQKKAVVANRDAARDAYYRALAQQFDESDHYVAQLKGELGGLNKKLSADLKQIENIAKTIKLLSDAVKTASALASLFV